MSEFTLGLMIEIVVACLLVTTIVYCYILNKRLTRLRADENVLRATISELITATEIAERAIRGLKATASDCEQSLGRRLLAAETTSSSLERRLNAAETAASELDRLLKSSGSLNGDLEHRLGAAADVVRKLEAIASLSNTPGSRLQQIGVDTTSIAMRDERSQPQPAPVEAIRTPVYEPKPAPAVPDRLEAARSLQQAASAAAERIATYRKSANGVAA
ncbi:chemotaxis protein [Hartmannibacter diazotrophicus]|uniref:Chemotaxis protein n=1 Tax=Hartmannibacter diazotrophicus TaxID=1482074 RepID=A0A2C9D7B7_9HYPH|nr:DUF6468 domain-containing protein [Hartmannibacter diazotrophicus]SON56212.1 chemotaxis protein [Hartmannibacter diazotrophicus]